MVRTFRRQGYACCIAAACGSLPAAAAQFTFTPIFVEGSRNVDATAINASGTIVGTYVDRTTQATQGFILASRKVTKLPSFPGGVLGASAAMPSAINAFGTVTGTYMRDPFTAVGWVWQHGAYVSGVGFVASTFGGPVPVLENRSGEVAYNANYGHDIFEQFAGPSTGPLPVQGLSVTQTTINSLNDHGFLAGTGLCTVRGATEICAFVGVSNNFKFIALPNAALVTGGLVNNIGQIAGSYTDSRDVSHGFIHYQGHFKIFDFPRDATIVRVTAINNSGRVAGVYTDSVKNRQHLYFYNGTSASIFHVYPASDGVNLALNDNGTLLLSVGGVGSTTSYIGKCSGDGC